MLELLSSSKATSSVCSFLMEIVDELVKTPDYGGIVDEDDPEEPIHIKPDFSVEWDWSQRMIEDDSDDHGSKLNYGSALLIPYMSSILTYLQRFLSHGLNARDLNVLMRVSQFVKEAQLSTELARMIIPAIKLSISRNRKNSTLEEKVTQYLSTLENLVQNAINPQQFIG